MTEVSKKWFLYVIETNKKNLYTGITTDVEKRFDTHVSGKGAKFFHTQQPKKIVYTEEFLTKSEALKKEHQIKKLSPLEKRKICSTTLKRKSKR